MVKRSKLEIIRDILSLIKENHNSIKSTPLLRKSNLSSSGFKEYLSELIEKGFIKESSINGTTLLSLTSKGFRFLEEYSTIINFIEEFGL